MNFPELTQAALLGTERQPLPAAAGGSALEQLQAQLNPAQHEQTFLSAAALAFAHEQTGRLPARDNSPLPAPCPSENLPRVSERAGSMLLRMLGGDFVELLPEWLALAAQSNQLAPPEALPSLLGVGTAKPELRESLLSVLGKRGHWLALQNPEWAWTTGATAVDDNIWHTGERPARPLFLQRLRRTEPDRARELLVSTWPEESPEDRAVFLAALQTGLSPTDEPFLESALDDKRKEVRRASANLLARLPQSAFVQRMLARAKPLLKFVPGSSGSLLKLKKPKPANVEITLPETCDKPMLRDGIEQKPPPGIGEKAWWLIQMLEAVPLGTWITAWQTTPAEILTGLLEGDWKKEMFEAWTRAAVHQANAEWAEAMFSVALDQRRFDKFEGLLGALPDAKRETQIAALLAADDAKTRDLHGGLVIQCRHAWSGSFSRAVLNWLRHVTAQTGADWQLRNQLKDFAARLAPAALAEAATGWRTDTTGWEFWSKGMDEFLAATQFRHDMINALQKP